MIRKPPPKPRKTVPAKALPGYYRAVEKKKLGDIIYIWIGIHNPGPHKTNGGHYRYVNKQGDYVLAKTFKEAQLKRMSNDEFYKKYNHLLNTKSEGLKNLYLK